MDADHTVRPPKPDQETRTHAVDPQLPTSALCGGTVTTSRFTVADADAVTCLACRARLRESGALPMTKHATAARKRPKRSQP